MDLVRGHVAFASDMGSDAPALLLEAAKRLEPLDIDLARETYLNAWRAASLAGRQAGASDMTQVSRAARSLPPPAHPPRPIDLILDGLARLVTDGPAAAGPARCRQAVTVFAAGHVSREEGLWSGWMAAIVLWDADAARAIVARQTQLARAVGALEELPVNLIALAYDDAWRGDFEATASLIAEIDAIAGATGSRIAPYIPMFLAALRGNEAELTPLIEAAIAVAEAEGQGGAVTYAYWSAAILNNGLGRYADALAAAAQARDDGHLFVSMWALPELVEAAVRTGSTEVAEDALELLASRTQVGGTDFGLGLEARCRALVSQGQAAEGRLR